MTDRQKITLKDLRSLYDLKSWMREKLNMFHGKSITQDQISITLNYLKERIKKSDLENKVGWLVLFST